MKTQNALLGLWAETSIHAGAGSSVDGVDLPIQREAHTGWPCVFGSAVKGALRAKAEDIWGKNESVKLIFGPDSESNNPADHAGALMVGDARLLLLPVRSLTGHFKWVSCPAMLIRLKRDALRLGMTLNFNIPSITDENVALQANESTTDLFLEEYRLQPQNRDLSDMIDAIHRLTNIDKEVLGSQLVLVHDNIMAFFTRYATAVTPHIAIDNKSKVVKKGALWYEETLPAETVMYCPLSANRARDMKDEIQDKWQAKAILDSVTKTLFKDSSYLQVGGNETVGMGWNKVTVMEVE